MPDLVDRMLQGNRYALARLITAIENRSTDVLRLMERIGPYVKAIPTLGITGPPGAGKSTFVDQMITRYRREDKQVAVIAVDPSSPFSGGAILGDRVRMQSHANDEGVFIRSLGSRGHFGGLTLSTSEVVRLFSAARFDVVLIETVGVGQTEFSVMEVADTVIVMLVPESGDTIQTLKAGLLEIADIFVVNKADREGADKIQSELRSMIQLRPPAEAWQVPVLLTIASKGHGIDRVFEAVLAHQREVTSTAEQDIRFSMKAFQDIVLEEISGLVSGAMMDDRGPARDLRDKIRRGELNPYGAALELLRDPKRLAALVTHRGDRSGVGA